MLFLSPAIGQRPGNYFCCCCSSSYCCWFFLIYALSTLTTVLPLFFPYLTPPNSSYLSLSTYPYSCPCISQNIRCRPRSRYWPCLINIYYLPMSTYLPTYLCLTIYHLPMSSYQSPPTYLLTMANYLCQQPTYQDKQTNHHLSTNP